LLGCLFAAAPFLHAQEDKGKLPWNGSHHFRNFLKLLKLRPLQSVEEFGKVTPRETLLIVFRRTDKLPLVAHQVGGLKKFREQGGAILIASHLPAEGPLRDELKASINGRRVFVDPWGRLEGYQGHDNCPILQNAEELRSFLPAGSQRKIATNGPSFVTLLDDSPLQILATFPSECVAENFPRPQDLRLPYIVGTGPEEQRAPVLVLGGHGVFLNCMLARRHDNDNAIFTVDCLRRLTAGGGRKYALFIDDGWVVGSFDVPLIRPPLPIVTLINAGLRKLEEEDAFNQLIQDNVPHEQLLKWLLLGVSGLLGLYGFGRLVRAQLRGEIKVPLVAARVAQDASEQPAVARRQEAAVEHGNCWEAARDLARLCFEGHAAAAQQPPTPPVPVRRNRRLQREVERLWRVAYGEPLPVSPAAFAVLVPMMARVRAALDDGALRFESSPRAAARGLRSE